METNRVSATSAASESERRAFLARATRLAASAPAAATLLAAATANKAQAYGHHRGLLKHLRDGFTE